ncbi:MAG: baseplate J/gp47 family protein [Clostridia bacterium]|nr:baseplate J/gp47 family protein [Clostridia bacterium]
MFEAMTYDSIMQRMMERIPDDMDKREGSVIWDALSPAALELELAYIFMDYVLLQAFADTQEREFLIRKAAERGITPDPATRAILKGLFAPESADVKGKRFSLGKLNYTAVGPVEGEAGAWQMQCETAGAIGNQSFGALVPVDYVEGLQSAQLTALLIPGEDEQSTESLREEYFASFTDIDYGGNIAGYLKMAKDIPGVGAAKVTPAWKGGGTVEITILDAAFNAATPTLIQEVQSIIDPKQDGRGDGLAFIDHIVTIDTAAETTVNVATAVSFETGYSWATMQQAVQGAVEAYFTELRKTWEKQDSIVVRISQIESRILALEGVVDVTGTRLNGAAENLVLDARAIPALGTVTNDG